MLSKVADSIRRVTIMLYGRFEDLSELSFGIFEVSASKSEFGMLSFENERGLLAGLLAGLP